jgi:hypothetical protein
MNDPGTRDSRRTAQRLVAHLADAAQAATVQEVRIGLGYTAVALTDGRAGVAYTFRDLAQGGCSVFHGLRPLAGRLAADLVPLLESADAIEAGVGLACANALANRSGPGQQTGDILAHLEVGPDDDVAMVGHFGPLVSQLEARARSLTIFERVAAPTGRLRPREEATARIPSCPIVLITATALINHTLDALLDAARGCRQVAILGASTPLVPEVFAATGVTMLSGVVVTAADEVLRVVSEGGGMPQFGPHVRKVNMHVGRSVPTQERFPR